MTSLPSPLVDVSVLMLFFNRPDSFRRVFEQVRLARPARLFLYQDGPRGDHDLPGIEACRQIVADEIGSITLDENIQQPADCIIRLRKE